MPTLPSFPCPTVHGVMPQHPHGSTPPARLTSPPPHLPHTFSWASFQKGRDSRAGRGDPHVLPTLFLVTPPFLLSRGHTV